jgi:hypothetical protein
MSDERANPTRCGPCHKQSAVVAARHHLSDLSAIFQDSSGDGVGDLQAIRRRLNYFGGGDTGRFPTVAQSIVP